MTFDELMIACISYGMSIDQFYNATHRDVYVFLKAKTQAKEDEVQQAWEYTRHIMWAAIKPHVEKNIKPQELIRLKRDGRHKQLTDYENQQIEKWNADVDKLILGK